MSAQIVAGGPTGEQAAAVIAAVQIMLEEAPNMTGPEAPWPYRSTWRRAAIEEGIRGADVS